ncbi:MAG: ATP-dependent Lon protease, partial [Clostridiales bacterium]|nr:ATP-dependent Lon protease [Clostridiales bacterium]
MPVFDFSNDTPAKKKAAECTYSVIYTNESAASAEKPILLLDNSQRQWKHHSNGIFSNPDQKTAFEFDEEGGTVSADILLIDARFVSLLRWLGESHIRVRLSGAKLLDGYA